jgi:polysaccharide export outer membrane protein
MKFRIAGIGVLLATMTLPMLLTTMALLTLLTLLTGCAGSQGYMAENADTADTGPSPPVQLINATWIKAEQQRRAQRTDRNAGKLVERDPSPYQIGHGDILSIVVWDHPELGAGVPAAQSQSGPQAGVADTSGVPPAGFVVDHQGLVQFPYAGTLKLAGLTEEQARALLAGKLARYIANPIVTLRVQSYRSQRIYIDGEVKSPGLQAINDLPMTLVEALNRAGGPLPSADQSRITLERGALRYPVNLPQMMQQGINPARVLLLHGDVLHVPSRDESKVFISGEVVAPKALTMHNGRLTLNEAMGEAGGLTPQGDGRQVFVVRRSGNEPQVFQLDARAPGALAMAEAFELEPRDVVYVAATRLANWHRNISQIFPGALSSAVGAAR